MCLPLRNIIILSIGEVELKEKLSDMFSSRQNYLCSNGPSNCDTDSKVLTAESMYAELAQTKSCMLHVKKKTTSCHLKKTNFR